MNMKVERVDVNRVIKKLELLGTKQEKGKVIDEEESNLRKRQFTDKTITNNHDSDDNGSIDSKKKDSKVDNGTEQDCDQKISENDAEEEEDSGYDEEMEIPEDERAMMEAMGIPLSFGGRR